jgi:hypothetical protein
VNAQLFSFIELCSEVCKVSVLKERYFVSRLWTSELVRAQSNGCVWRVRLEVVCWASGCRRFDQLGSGDSDAVTLPMWDYNPVPSLTRHAYRNFRTMRLKRDPRELSSYFQSFNPRIYPVSLAISLAFGTQFSCPDCDQRSGENGDNDAGFAG